MTKKYTKPDRKKIHIADGAIRKCEEEIRFRVVRFRIEDLHRKFESDQFYIPDYQRDDIWNMAMRSKFIESVLLGLPIPDIFACRQDDEEDYYEVSKFEVIDGSQRLRTLNAFMKDEFFLRGLKKIQELNGFKYSDLTEHRKDRFKDVPIEVIILDSNTSDEVKNEMFDRINTSNPLKDMELRRGSHAGLFNNLLREVGDLLKKNPKHCPIHYYFKKRQEEEELLLRFFAFSETFACGLSFTDTKDRKVSKKDMGLSDFLTEFYKWQNTRLKELKEDSEEEYSKEIERLKTNFTHVLNFVKQNFPNGFRKKRSKSVSRSMFEAISVGTHLALQEKKDLLSKKINIDWAEQSLQGINDQRYYTSTVKNIKKRIQLVKTKILENE